LGITDIGAIEEYPDTGRIDAGRSADACVCVDGGKAVRKPGGTVITGVDIEANCKQGSVGIFIYQFQLLVDRIPAVVLLRMEARYHNGTAAYKPEGQSLTASFSAGAKVDSRWQWLDIGPFSR
jgi:hypothetical protein